ncbi:uncharacterized protein LOC143592985 [Bidens hawaiensis]|uniref:uncharacterized protein LOC143592985 n=1 Tax=Bidens hawaiensis TaxID=980011 RepID=UPI00404928F4
MNHCNIFHHSLTLILTLFLSIPPTHQQQLATTDLIALQQITYSLTDVNSGMFFATWNFTSPEYACSTFSGVTCSVIGSQLRVTALYLGTGLSGLPGLAGTVPESVYQLTELTQLILYAGIVTGFIPSEIGRRLKNLRIVSLTDNRITGTIPASFSELQYLHTLDLSHNQLTGSIPPELTSLPDLKVLVLSSNKLVGKVPNFSDESKLIHLDISKNNLTGTLPDNVPVTLSYLSLSSNGLWGPVQFMMSTNLIYLDLSMNKFSGPIPEILFTSSVTSLFLQRNNFSGVLTPSSSSRSRSLVYGRGTTVDLSHNFITGEIPSFLNTVETLFLNNNHFSGEVPESYVSNVVAGIMRTLYLQHNYLTGCPVDNSMVLSGGAALCLSYNCMVPPAVGLMACPASAGGPVSRPFRQCEGFRSGNTLG